MGILVAPQERNIETQVMPWLMNKICDFIREDEAATNGAEEAVENGFKDAQNTHSSVIKAKYDAIEQARVDKIEFEKSEVERKIKRREAREIRAKDLELEKQKDQIQRNVIFKGEVQDVLKTNLTEIHGFFRDDAYIGAIGGQVRQLYYVVEEIIKKYPQGLKTYKEKKIESTDVDYFARPNNLRELCLDEHLVPFIMSYLKDMKNECIELYLHPLCEQFLKEKECPLDDLSELSEENLKEFRTLFIDNKPLTLRDCGDSMDEILSHLIKIIAKQIPTENVTVSIDSILNKVKFVTCPENLQEDYVETKIIEPEEGEPYEEKVTHEADTVMQALIKIYPTQYEEEEEIPIEVTSKKGE